MNGSFWGWYFKCQSDTQTLAVIPAIHKTGKRKTCSIQVITDTQTWNLTLPPQEFRRAGGALYIGKNRFGADGLRLDISKPNLNIHGILRFGPLTPLRYDIMGPFALIPFLECRHRVCSMRHTVQGTVWINGTAYGFSDALGYWEGDQGRSFPRRYLWTQCFFPGGSLMLSVADIPMPGFDFTGIIGVVMYQGKEYRLATYLGAKAVKLRGGTVRIVQGDLRLEARLLEASGHPLKAPQMGHMARTIHESAACRASYRFQKGKDTLLSFETDRASFEYEY